VLGGVGAYLVREGLIDAAPAGMRIDARPDRLSGLAVFGEHMPLHCRDCRPVQCDVVLAGAAVPYRDGALAVDTDVGSIYAVGCSRAVGLHLERFWE
jgi:hypothetical protein